MPQSDDFTPRVILKLDCPFSLKFRIFLAEAGLADRFRFEVVEEGTPAYDEAKKILKKSGTESSFPAVETGPDQYMSDSDTVIDHYAEAFDINRKTLPLLTYYEEGVFNAMTEMFKENKKMKAKLDTA
ncbi:glutathione S-transferase N-terminal domain-containing protein [Henriciella sp.]|mgnify:CR=1 FL=1|uniref:glutathione S-transferase N-terminal domain-containing protein n=1 Tax=Henriciella sp. TaxID=1968823 RepID=UPI0026163FAE|nr:glutathione S-transferase N-terminal domain-containing protein [Henriciella sp.]